jgi:protein TonB
VTQPAPPVQKPAPIPEPVKPTPIPEKPKWKPAKVVRQNKRVAPKTTPTPTPVKPNLSSLQKAFKGGTFNPHATYYNTVRSRIYGLWQVPVAAPFGLSAEGSITLSASGSVSARRLTRRSGNTAFDESAQSALNKLTSLPPPPADLPSRTISILFEPE